MPNRPVIFLAFANDLTSPTRNLQSLSVEEKRLRAAFEDHPLVELVVDDNASIDSIVRTFEREKYRGRIAIFHFGGHADGFQLMLESAKGDHEIAHGAGLVEFFALQRSLKLIFLNGCSTEQQAIEMTERGLPMVVGTSQSIDDTIATELSGVFYESLAQGSSIGRAWDTATASVRMRNKSENGSFRSLYWPGMDQSIEPDRFPWSLHLRSGAEAVRDWSLPEAAEDLTFGLPLIPDDIGIPSASPFMMLSRYEREQARVFLGRGKYIRELYEKVTMAGAPPVILLYGQTGAGKSSLFEAGLRPRLEGRKHPQAPGSDYEVRYVRRNQTKGLLGTLAMSLRYVDTAMMVNKPKEAEKPAEKPVVNIVNQEFVQAKGEAIHDTIAQIERLILELEPEKRTGFEALLKALRAQEIAVKQAAQSGQRKALDMFSGAKVTGELLRQAWIEIEKQTGRKLVIVLDQVEEAFTQPMTGTNSPETELAEFAQAMAEIFDSATPNPEGRLLLGYRKEYHPDLSKIFRNSQVPATEIYLEHLSRGDIKDILKGLSPADPASLIRLTYNLSVQDGVAESIAEALYSQKDVAIGPVLQILLVNMWEQAKQENSAAPLFSRAMFEQMQQSRLGMEAFYTRQMGIIAAERPDLVNSGLALELMAFHVTENVTSARRSSAEVRNTFSLGKFPSRVEDFFAQAGFSLEQRAKDIDWLLKRMQEVSLLGASGAYTTLIHDTLAPIVQAEYGRSTRNGQRAIRVVTTQTPLFLASMRDPAARKKAVSRSAVRKAWDRWVLERDKDAPVAAAQQPAFAEVILEDGELEVMELGLSGMRLLSADEQTLLVRSLQRREERRRRNRQYAQTGLMTVIAFVFISILAFISWNSSQNQKGLLSVTNAHYLSQDLATEGTPESRRLALGLAEQAYSKSSPRPIDVVRNFFILSEEEMRREALKGDKKAFMEVPYGVSLAPGLPLSAFRYNANLGLLTGHSNGTARLWNFSGKDLQTYRHGKPVSEVRFSPDGVYVATISGENRRQLYLIHGQLMRAPTVKVMRRPGKNEQDQQGTVTAYANGLERIYNPASGVLIEKDPVSGMERTYMKNRLTEYYQETAQKFVYDREQAMLTQYEFSDSLVYRYSLKKDKRYEVWVLKDFKPDSLIGPYYLMDLSQKKQYGFDFDGKVMSTLPMEVETQADVQTGIRNFRAAVEGMEAMLGDYEGLVEAMTVRNTPLVIGEYDYFRGEFKDVHGQIFTNHSDLEDAWMESLQAAYDNEYQTLGDSLYVEGAAKRGINGIFGIKLWDESIGRIKYSELKKIPYTEAVAPLKTLLAADTLLPVCLPSPFKSSERNHIKIWQKKEGSLIREFELPGEIAGFLLSPANSSYLTFSGKKASLWDADETARPVVEMVHSQPIIQIMLSPDNQHFITQTADSAAVWSLDGHLNSRLACSHAVVFEGEGQGIALVGDNAVKLFLPENNHPLTLAHSQVQNAALSPDGEYLLTWSQKQIKVWRRNGQSVMGINVKDKLLKADFAAGGPLITAFSRDTVWCWNMERRKLVQQFPFDGGAIDATITPDLKRAVTISPNQVVSVWDEKGRLRGRWTAGARIDEQLLMSSSHSDHGQLVQTEDLVRVSFAPRRNAIVVRSNDNQRVEWLDLDAQPIEAIAMNSGYKLGFQQQFLTPDGQFYVAAAPKELFLWRAADKPLFDWLRDSNNLLTADEKADYGLADIEDRLDGRRTRSELALGVLILLSTLYLLFVYVRRQFLHYINRRYMAFTLYTSLYALFFAIAFVAWSYTPERYVPFFGLFVGIAALLVTLNAMWINAGNPKQHYFRLSLLYAGVVLASMGLYLWLTPIARIGWGLLADFALAMLTLLVFVLPVYLALKQWAKGREEYFFAWLLIPAGAVITLLAVFFGSVNVHVTRSVVTVIAVAIGLIIGYLQIRRYRRYKSYIRIAVYSAICLLVLFTRTYDSPFDTGLYLAAALAFIRAVRNYQDKDWGWAFGDVLAGVAILAGMIPVAYAPTSTAYLLDIPIITAEALIALTAEYWVCRLYDQRKISERMQWVYTLLLIALLAIFAVTHRSIRLDPSLRSNDAYFSEKQTINNSLQLESNYLFNIKLPEKENKDVLFA